MQTRNPKIWGGRRSGREAAARGSPQNLGHRGRPPLVPEPSRARVPSKWWQLYSEPPRTGDRLVCRCHVAPSPNTVPTRVMGRLKWSRDSRPDALEPSRGFEEGGRGPSPFPHAQQLAETRPLQHEAHRPSEAGSPSPVSHKREPPEKQTTCRFLDSRKSHKARSPCRGTLRTSRGLKGKHRGHRHIVDTPWHRSLCGCLRRSRTGAALAPTDHQGAMPPL